MVIDTSKITSGSWKTTVTGWLTAVVLWLQSWLLQGHKLNWHDPMLVVGIAAAVLGSLSKDNDVTGGTKLATGAVPDAALHAEAAQQAAAPK